MNQLKPVVFVQGKEKFYRPNYYVQNILIKALSEGVTDPEELRKLASLERVADVYRSLDKLAIRKEYHDALARSGISLDYIVSKIKDLADNAEKDDVKLHSLQTLLKSIGLEKYEQQEGKGKSWEELIMQIEQKKEPDKKNVLDGDVDYEVKVPQMPEPEKKIREIEKTMGKELYGE
jgi:hypothetical protein